MPAAMPRASTPAACASSRAHLAEIPLSVSSMALWERIEDLVGDDCGFESHGTVLVAESEAELGGLPRPRRRPAAQGLHARGADRPRRAAAPGAGGRPTTAPAAWSRGATARPIRSAPRQAFRRKRAIERGAEVIEGVTVTGLARAGDVWRVETSDGPIEAPKVVNAAGAWADRIAAMLGEPVPLEVIAPMLMVTSRRAGLHRAGGDPARPQALLQAARQRHGGDRRRPSRDALSRRATHRARLEQARDQRAHGVGAVPGDARRRPSCAPGPASRRACPTTFRWSGRAPRRRACSTSSASPPHGFQLGPGTGAVMAELVATGATNVPIAGLGHRSVQVVASARDASRSPAAGSGRRPRRPRDRVRSRAISSASMNSTSPSVQSRALSAGRTRARSPGLGSPSCGCEGRGSRARHARATASASSGLISVRLPWPIAAMRSRQARSCG